LDTIKVNQLAELINIKSWGKNLGLKYSVVYQRLRNDSVLRPMEVHKLLKGLLKFGLKIKE
jgi:hypothetical protein